MPYKELLEKLPPTFLDSKVEEFTNKLLSRIGEGKKSYPTEYRFDPLEEAQQECLDIAVYAMIEYYRIGRLKKELDELGNKKS